MNYDKDKPQQNDEKQKRSDSNRDPITGAPGAHPVGTGIGAAAGGAGGLAGGAAIGAATGTATGGPVGAAVGAVAGAIAGGAIGKAAAERVNPTEEDAYWREHHSSQPYYDASYSYDDYQGAYRTGYEGWARHAESGRSFDECESELRQDYESKFPGARLKWDQAQHATRAAWDRFGRRLDQYIDYDVLDQNNEKIGTLECLWSDHRGEPSFVGIRTGWIFGRTHVVPAESVEICESARKLRIPYTSDKVKGAPSYDADVEMSREKEEETYRYYGRNPHSEVSPASPKQEAVSGRESTARATPEMATIQLNEEQVRVGKREVEVGGVRLRKIVRTEVVNQPVELKREELVIERVPAEQAHTGRQQAFKEQEVYIPLRREEPVIAKETRLREEVRARKTTQTEQQQVSESVRKEDLEIDETGEARRTKPRPGRTPAGDLREREEQPRSMRRHKP